MKGKSIFLVAITLLFIGILAFLVYPFAMMVVSSFQNNTQDAFTFSNYAEVLTKPMYLTAFMNSILISVISSTSALLLTIIATYAIKAKSEKFQNNILVMANLDLQFCRYTACLRVHYSAGQYRSIYPA